MNVAPEVRKRLNDLLTSEFFMGSAVGYSAFIDRACEAAETAIAQASRSRAQWCPVCRSHHDNPGEKTDRGALIRRCPMLPDSDPRNIPANYPARCSCEGLPNARYSHAPACDILVQWEAASRNYR